MIQAITFYNNKGGVSKTTTAFNVGVYLSKILNKKILLIDADPQCNLTELFFASNTEIMDNPENDLPGTSILDAFQDRIDGASHRIDISKIKTSKCKIYPNLDLIRGDFQFSARAEQYFASAIDFAITSRVNEKNTYVSFKRLIDDYRDKYDYIITDVGPSSGALTRLAFLASDGFFIPVSPDRFSMLAIKVLKNLFTEWKKTDELIFETLSPFGIEVNKSFPVFLGSISQKYQKYQGKAKKVYDVWSNKITEELKSCIKDGSLQCITEEIKNKPIISEVEDLGPLLPVAQIVGKAIFDISQDDSTYLSEVNQKFYGQVWDTYNIKLIAYKDEIKKIVESLII